jgi:hypothetical protein
MARPRPAPSHHDTSPREAGQQVTLTRAMATLTWDAELTYWEKLSN